MFQNFRRGGQGIIEIERKRDETLIKIKVHPSSLLHAPRSSQNLLDDFLELMVNSKIKKEASMTSCAEYWLHSSMFEWQFL